MPLYARDLGSNFSSEPYVSLLASVFAMSCSTSSVPSPIPFATTYEIVFAIGLERKKLLSAFPAYFWIAESAMPAPPSRTPPVNLSIIASVLAFLAANNAACFSSAPSFLASLYAFWNVCAADVAMPSVPAALAAVAPKPEAPMVTMNRGSMEDMTAFTSPAIFTAGLLRADSYSGATSVVLSGGFSARFRSNVSTNLSFAFVKPLLSFSSGDTPLLLTTSPKKPNTACEAASMV